MSKFFEIRQRLESLLDESLESIQKEIEKCDVNRNSIYDLDHLQYMQLMLSNLRSILIDGDEKKLNSLILILQG